MTLDEYLKSKRPPLPAKKPSWLQRMQPKDLTGRLAVTA